MAKDSIIIYICTSLRYKCLVMYVDILFLNVCDVMLALLVCFYWAARNRTCLPVLGHRGLYLAGICGYI